MAARRLRPSLAPLAAAALLAAAVAPPASADPLSDLASLLEASEDVHFVPASAISAGGYNTCVLLVDGNVDCYGSGLAQGELDHTGGDAVAVSGGGLACALTSAGNVDCWGWNDYGQADDYAGGDAAAVAAGQSHSCILTQAGDIDCRGYNGQIGMSADYNGGDAVAVATGTWHTCAVLASGNVDCWGSNADGENADYAGGDAVGAAAGLLYTCLLLESGNVDCYGRNTHGQANDYAGGDAVAVAAHYYHTCILTSAGNVDCQGKNDEGQATDYNGGDAVGLGLGIDHTCILKEDGQAFCQGSNDEGQAEPYDSLLTRTLLHVETLPVPSQPTPPVGVPFVATPDHDGSDPVTLLPVGTVWLHDEGSSLCADFLPASGGLIPLACVGRSFLGPADGLVPRGQTPLAVGVPGTPAQPVPDAGPVPLLPAGSTPALAATMDVTYGYDANRLDFLASLAGSAEAWSPLAPTAGDAAWLLEHGDETALTVSVTLVVDGAPRPPVAFSVPFLGQALAAADASGLT